MKIIFYGTPDFAVGSLEKCIGAGHEVIGVVTQPDRQKGRGNQIQMSPVKECALKHDIPVYQPERVRDEESCAELEAISGQADVGVVVAFGQIMPARLLDAPRLGCVNVHASLLPAYRGAAPIQWAILDGLKTTGVTIMQMDEGLDTGDILTQKRIRIGAEETGGGLFDRLAELGAKLLVDTLPKLDAGELTPTPQGETTTAYAKMMTKEMGEIDWSLPAVQIERQIRGLNPWPSAYTKVNGKTLKIWKAMVWGQVKKEQSEDEAKHPRWDIPTDQKPGTVIVKDKRNLVIQCGEGALALEEVQMEGKKRMEITEFLRGMRNLHIGA